MPRRDLHKATHRCPKCGAGATVNVRTATVTHSCPSNRGRSVVFVPVEPEPDPPLVCIPAADLPTVQETLL